MKPRSKRFSRSLHISAGALALALVLVACGDESDDSNAGTSDSDQAPSGDLLVYTTPNDANKVIAEEFTKVYPDVEVTFAEYPAAQMVERYRSESRANRSNADIIFRAQGSEMSRLVADGMLAEATSDNFDNYPDGEKEAPYWVNVTPGIYGIMYNTNKVDPPPDPATSYEYFLDEKFKGRLVMSSPKTSSATYESFVAMYHDPEFGEEFFERLAQMDVHLVEGGAQLYQSVATGQYDASIFQPMYHWYNGAANGDPVGAVFPPEGVGQSILGVGVALDAPNPVAAQAFWDWLTGPDGQAVTQQFFIFSSNDEATPLENERVIIPELPRLVDYSSDTVVDSDQEEWLAKFDELFGS